MDRASPRRRGPPRRGPPRRGPPRRPAGPGPWPILALASLLWAPAAAQVPAAPAIFLDARDPWSLHDRRLLNRKLPEQLRAAGQRHRLVDPGGVATAAADLSIGTQLAWPEAPLAPYHGSFILDAFAAVQVHPGVSLNLNLIALNRTASAGYRQATQLLPGLALHLEGGLGQLAGRRIRGEFLTTDLQEVTLGHGLLLERTPLEGHAGRLQIGDDIELWEVFGGEGLWRNDDLQAGGLRLFGGRLDLTWLSWLQGDEPRSDYLSLGAALPGLPDRLRIALEASARLPLSGGAAAAAGLLRIDWLDRAFGDGSWHIGYQLRGYQRGFGPRSQRLAAPLAAFALPTREDSYVTNPFEFYALSKLYHQLAHTVMIEASVPVRWGLEFVLELEWIARYAVDPSPPIQVFSPRPGQRLPGWALGAWNKIGLQYRPFRHLPHRGRLLLSDKHVDAGLVAQQPTERRFVEMQLLSFELEIFL